MLYPAIHDLLKKIDNRYLLVNVTAARARQIAEEAESHHIHLSEKPVRLATNEIAEGRLHGDLKEGVESASDK